MQEEKIQTEEIEKLQSNDVKLYQLDVTHFELPVPIEEFIVYHRLKKPTARQLAKHTEQTLYESEQVVVGKQKVRNSDNVGADAHLWDELAEAVKGYDGFDPDEWVPVASLESVAITSEIKSEAIRSLYQDMTFKVEESKSTGPKLLSSNMTFTIVQTMPDYIIRHYFHFPPESARRKFRQEVTEVFFDDRGGKTKTAIQHHLQSYIDLYNKVFKRIDGVSIGGSSPTVETLPQCLDLIDAVWKRNAVDCLMKKFSGKLRD